MALRSLLASTGVALFALAGCEDYLPFSDGPGGVQVVYLNGEPDHCIDVPKSGARPQPAPSRSKAEPAIAHRWRLDDSQPDPNIRSYWASARP